MSKPRTALVVNRFYPMPTLFAHLLLGRFDLIQAFRSLSKNALVALAAAKLTGKPFVFCSFDYLDDAEPLGRAVSRSDETPIERLVLRHLAQVFAISQREFVFVQKLTYPTRINAYERACRELAPEVFGRPWITRSPGEMHRS
jgi:hypothetical protein